MPRDEGTDRLRECEEARQRLRGAIARSARLVSDYRARLLLLRRGARRPAPGPNGPPRQAPRPTG